MIDLRSDTATRPTRRHARGDRRRGRRRRAAAGGPDRHALQDRAAELLGQEAALFLPTATMANQIALKLHSRAGRRARRRGVLRTSSSTSTAAPAVHAGAHDRGAPRRRRPLQRRAARGGDDREHEVRRPARARCSRSRTPTTPSGGRVLAARRARGRCTAAARERGLATHLDGARLLNAAVATGVPAAGSAASSTPSRSASRRASAARSARCSPGSHETIGQRAAREAPLRRRDASGGHRRGGRRLRARAPRRPARRRPSRAPRRLAEGWHAAGLPVDLDAGRDELRPARRRRPRPDARRGARAARARAASGSRRRSTRRWSARSRTSTSTTPTRARDRARARAPSGSVPRLTRSASDLDRISPPRRPSSGCRRSSRRSFATARSSGGALGSADVGAGEPRRRPTRVPHRLDHEDLHGRPHPPAPRRRASSLSTTRCALTSRRCRSAPPSGRMLSHT